MRSRRPAASEARPGGDGPGTGHRGEAQYVHLAEGLAGEFGHLDGLLHNASVLGEMRPIESASYTPPGRKSCRSTSTPSSCSPPPAAAAAGAQAPRSCSPPRAWAAPGAPTGAPTRYPNSPPRASCRCSPRSWKTPRKSASTASIPGHQHRHAPAPTRRRTPPTTRRRKTSWVFTCT